MMTRREKNCSNCLMLQLPAISLTQEESEIFTMTRPPRNPVKDRLVSYRLYGLVYCQIGILEACAGMFT